MACLPGRLHRFAPCPGLLLALISPDAAVDWRGETPEALAVVLDAAAAVSTAGGRRTCARKRAGRRRDKSRRQAVLAAPAAPWPRAAAEVGGGPEGAHRHGPGEVFHMNYDAATLAAASPGGVPLLRRDDRATSVTRRNAGGCSVAITKRCTQCCSNLTSHHRQKEERQAACARSQLGHLRGTRFV